MKDDSLQAEPCPGLCERPSQLRCVLYNTCGSLHATSAWEVSLLSIGITTFVRDSVDRGHHNEASQWGNSSVSGVTFWSECLTKHNVL